MKKKMFLGLIIFIIIFLIIMIFLSIPNGKTLESREKILKSSPSGKYVWEIDEEIKLYDYIISSVYGKKEGLAVYKFAGNNCYKLQSVSYREKGKVIFEQIIHQGNVYYIAWCNQANLSYAEVIYSINGQELEPITFDVSKNSLISFTPPSDDFSLRIIYYDKDGNIFD